MANSSGPVFGSLAPLASMFMSNGGYSAGGMPSFGGGGYGTGGVNVPTISAPAMPLNIQMPKSYTPQPIPTAAANPAAKQPVYSPYSDAGWYFGRLNSNGKYSGWSPR